MTEQPNSNLHQPTAETVEQSDAQNVIANGDPSVRPPSRRKYRLGRLVLKELRETLRDRRTIVTLLLMPLLVYPALSLVFKTYLLSNVGLLGNNEPIQLIIAYGSDTTDEDMKLGLHNIVAGIELATEQKLKKRADPPPLGQQQEAGSSQNQPGDLLGIPEQIPKSPNAADPASEQKSLQDKLASKAEFVPFAQHKPYFIWQADSETVESVVESGFADVGVFLSRKGREDWENGQIRIVARNDQVSQLAKDYLQTELELLNDFELEQRLKNAGQPVGPFQPFSNSVVGAVEERQSSFPLASLVPLVLVLMTITGAVYPAIDLTAGERERGTLETLMAAPVPRFGILFSKFTAVLTVAVLTAVLNLIGMFATVWAFQLDKQFGIGTFNISVMFQILLLLVLFAAFFSALLLAVTSFAKSFKEAQVYLIPIILLSLGPGLMAMAPGMSLDGIYSVVPMINILLLARDVILNEVLVVPAIVTIVSTLFYAYLAVRLAAWIFGSDGILGSGQGNFVEMFWRPVNVNQVVPITATLFCLLLLFPINFASLGCLGRLSSETTADLQYRYLLMGLFTFIAFMIVPWVVAKHQNTDIRTGFGLNMPKLTFLVAAVLIGVSLWTIVMSMTASWHNVYGYFFGAEAQAQWRHRLIEVASAQFERIGQIPPLIILLCFSIIPAVCEEWFFRGMLFRSLMKSGSLLKATLISAIVFGVFHTLGNSAIDRLIPSTLVGIMLGYLAYKSDSIIPGIVLHSLNNAVVIFMAYFEPQLRGLDWFPGKGDPIPLQWVVSGGLIAAIGIGLIYLTKRPVEAKPLRQAESSKVAEVGS